MLFVVIVFVQQVFPDSYLFLALTHTRRLPMRYVYVCQTLDEDERERRRETSVNVNEGTRVYVARITALKCRIGE